MERKGGEKERERERWKRRKERANIDSSSFFLLCLFVCAAMLCFIRASVQKTSRYPTPNQETI